MRDLTQMQEYLVNEFVDDYNDGLMPRRAMIHRVLRIMGSAAGAATILTSLGVRAEDALATQASPPPSPASSQGSPLSVAEDDPGVVSKDITFESGGATISAYEARPNPMPDGAVPLILVCHENRGLTPHIRDIARRITREGYVALAVDLVSRDGGTTAHEEADIPDLLTRVDPARHVADFQAAIGTYAGDTTIDAGRIGMTGFCFGGGITWRSATAIAELKAVIPWYGPPPPLDDVPNIEASVLGIYAEDPGDFANKGRDELDAALAAAGIDYRINIYPGTEHAFNNDTGPRYNQEQSLAAWRDAMQWFADKLV
jgi:carboxymethylenebutenolidase